METENIYKHLTDEEWNDVSKFTADNKLDEVFDICTDENGDYFYDYELNSKVPFEEYLCYLADNIYTSGVYYPSYDRQFRNLIEEIFNKYCEHESVKSHVRIINEILNAKNEN